MPAVGITGGISTGKSTFCGCLREIVPAAKFFDADLAARSLPELPEVKQEILGQFGGGVFSPDGDLNRTKLRAIVFADAAKRRALEQILHPRIRRQWMAEAKKHRNSPDFFFADIPLLYETGGETLCERVVAHDYIWPHRIDQFVFGNEATGVGDQVAQKLEAFRS